MPDAKVVRIHGAGHTVHHDAPDAFHAAADPFLAAKVPVR
jgi:pimeloyl-ACP methyl ester carboxylesterase